MTFGEIEVACSSRSANLFTYMPVAHSL